MSIQLIRHGIWLPLLTFMLALQGCLAHLPSHTIAIQDESTAPNISITPAEMTLKAGEAVTWINRTNSVMELDVWQGEENETTLIERVRSKIRSASQDKDASDPSGESPDRLAALEDALKDQQDQLAQIKTQINTDSQNPGGLEDKIQTLEKRLAEQEAQLNELKTATQAPQGPQKLSHIPAFIPSLATVRVKFDQPGHYTFTLFQSNPSRRSSQVKGRIIVLP